MSLQLSEKVLALAAEAQSGLTEQFARIDAIAEENTRKVLAAFQNHRVAESYFAGTTGYGYDDQGRDELDKIYAEIFGTEEALVRIQFVNGTHIHFLSRTPSPKIIADAFATVKPDLIITVPLVIEKIIKKKVFPTIEKPHMKLLMNIPIINDKIRESIRQKVIDAFGGKFKELIIGGAALNKEVEIFLRSIRFPYTVGYGMTECGPLLTYDNWKTFRQSSCGKAVPRVELRIDSGDPQHIVGEILAKGICVMTGYYKNPEATAAAIDRDGWLHTGDMGIIDQDGYLFIKGRCKNMILSSNGQNIYPEEIEDKLNNMPYISESIVIEKEGKLVALIYPDFDLVNEEKITDEKLDELMTANLKEINQQLPAYSQLNTYKLYNEEFEKTPKRSIKRFLYQ